MFNKITSPRVGIKARLKYLNSHLPIILQIFLPIDSYRYKYTHIPDVFLNTNSRRMVTN